MYQYYLFGKNVEFTAGEIRFYEILKAKTRAMIQAGQEISEWYKRCEGIEEVLKNYNQIAVNVLQKLAEEPLMSALRENGVYDISEEYYRKNYLSVDESMAAFSALEERYYSIVQTQENEEAYREARKNARGKWVGGGFGMGGAIKGALQAGVMNTVTGAGHSMFNSAGNMMSSFNAASSKAQLYKSSATEELLKEGVAKDVAYAYNAFMNLLNERYKGYVLFSFSSDQSSALLESAKQIPKKREELLVQAFEKCPWNYDVYAYIFQNYPDQRSIMVYAAQDFDVDLTDIYNEIISAVYSEEARESEEAAQEAKKEILSLMEEFQIEENSTLDELECDCLNRLCGDIERMDEEQCEQAKEKIANYDAREKNKEQVLKEIKQRIEKIWSAEDERTFEKLYLEMDVNSAEDKKRVAGIIKNSDRTNSGEAYLKAIEACTPENMKRAKEYQDGKLPALLSSAACGFLIEAGLNIFMIKAGGFFTLIFLLVGSAFGVLEHLLHSKWNELTVNDTALHPMITQGNHAKDNTTAKIVGTLLIVAVLSVMIMTI